MTTTFKRCDQCADCMINGVYCHETGCPNTGKAPVSIKRRYYVGIHKVTRTRHSFVTGLDPTPHYYPEFSAVIGPFKTRRASVWAAANPFGWGHVSEAELLSKGTL
jgi:hypothetical protein